MRKHYERYIVQFKDYAEPHIHKVSRTDRRNVSIHFEVRFPSKIELNKMKLKEPELYEELLLQTQIRIFEKKDNFEEQVLWQYCNIHPEVLYQRLDECEV